MEDFATRLFERAGTTREDALLMSELLVANDLRCVFSHGTLQIPEYVRKMVVGDVNPRPELRDVNESAGALVIDGDGGLGYFPCYRGTQRAITKARVSGVAALTTRNHHHFGAAGNYTRLALSAGCIGMAVSSHRTSREAGESIYSTVTNSPISVAFPTREQPPVVLDMGGGLLSFDESSCVDNPFPFFKAMGLSTIVQLLGGVFPGIYQPQLQAPASPWESNQGSFILVIDVSHFMPPDELRDAVDRYVGEVRAMELLPGSDRAEVAGGVEWRWEQENRRKGIPVSPEHQLTLERVARELRMESPF